MGIGRLPDSLFEQIFRESYVIPRHKQAPNKLRVVLSPISYRQPSLRPYSGFPFVRRLKTVLFHDIEKNN